MAKSQISNLQSPINCPAPASGSAASEPGAVRMVDVTEKPATDRFARARGYVLMQRETLRLLQAGELPKGDVLATARLAGILAAKRTPELIPLCHPLPLSSVEVHFRLHKEVSTLFPEHHGSAVEIEARVRVRGPTGVEMEALTAVAVAALTIYDMAKAVDQSMTLTGIRLLEKTGGKSDYRPEAPASVAVEKGGEG
ncbi:MAG TPA: cyclic pyranopterin monophosphate synthase MoaC [Armatimonadetes bacterium]|nr:cyclic pyranopterin monophosphate synthase MoaC [Armatimonadota bacterium]